MTYLTTRGADPSGGVVVHGQPSSQWLVPGGPYPNLAETPAAAPGCPSSSGTGARQQLPHADSPPSQNPWLRH